MQTIYVSTDIETDGKIPGPNSMLSIGSAAFLSNGTLVDTFSANLETLPGAAADLDTAEWWKTQPEAWAACRTDLQDPAEAMMKYVMWLSHLPGKPVFVGYPAGFDFTWVYWYLIKFTGNSPFSFSALDIKSYASAVLKIPYRDATKRNFPKRWFGPSKHSHIAVEDAIEQGQLFINILQENMDSRGPKP